MQPHSLPSINGVVLVSPQEAASDEELRQRACTELLRQAAIQVGLLPADDPAPQDGATTEAASTAIEALLERELHLPEPTEEACRRHHAANLPRYAHGERAHVRHVLFAVTPGVDVNKLRSRAEACLLDLRCDGTATRFAPVAGSTSNCPSGAEGGDLGWLTAQDCAPEFSREVLGHAEIGVLPRLVATRFGLHVVEVLAREPGTQPPFEAVRSAVTQALRQQAFATALRQYLQLLAGQARIEGVELEASDTPLVQ
ncbi:MAG: peptidylprolyl isomerase [Rubrivivax sp.]|nr:peptidylprolyl isomerase [Rubrivivax sp.]